MDKRGSSHTKVEIILALAESEDGLRKREDFLISNFRGGTEVRDKKKFLSERLNSRESNGIGIMEKSLSELKRDGLIEQTSIGEGIFFKRAYRLLCSDIYDLSKIFNFILDAERAKTSDPLEYRRLEKFIKSPFFEKKWYDCILDIVYDLELWDEGKYPLKIKNVAEIKKYTRQQNPLRVSSFFRKYFPNQGPGKYENGLREYDFPTALLISLNGEIRQYINLFTFLKMFYDQGEGKGTLSDKFATQRIALNAWFNNFWYGNLDLESYLSGDKQLKKEACMLGTAGLVSGANGFENGRTWDQSNGVLEEILFPLEIWRAEILEVKDLQIDPNKSKS